MVGSTQATSAVARVPKPSPVSARSARLNVTAGLLSPSRAEALLDHLLHAGSINKSGYAQLCGTGLATASKHLAQLALSGALQQTGRGPSTRYRLPDLSS